MSDPKFLDLLGRLLDGGLDPDDRDELIRLVREDPGRREELRRQLEADEWLSLSEDDLRDASRFLSAIRSRWDDRGGEGRSRTMAPVGANGRGGTSPPSIVRRARPARRAPAWAAAVLLLLALALTASVVGLGRGQGREIARITAIHGALRWIGDGGIVSEDLRAGMGLGGGTIDAMSSDAWVSLEFRDGSTVTVSGPSMLTISEGDQKRLHLREGSLFAEVARQGRGRPLLIHTRTAEMEVLGTQLDVEAEASATLLSVVEGRVRLTRLVDGSVAEVPARHQVVATADRTEPLSPTRRPDPVDRWQSDLMASMGRWLPPGDGVPARLRAIPLIFNRPREGPVALYVAGFDASPCGSPPVRLEGAATFRVRGRVESARDVHFEITARRPGGGFGGKFKAVLPAETFEAGGRFDVEIPLADLEPQHAWVSVSPIGSDLENCSLFTVDVDAGLEILGVELLPPSSAS